MPSLRKVWGALYAAVLMATHLGSLRANQGLERQARRYRLKDGRWVDGNGTATGYWKPDGRIVDALGNEVARWR
jgi:hypothetical protein